MLDPDLALQPSEAPPALASFGRVVRWTFHRWQGVLGATIVALLLLLAAFGPLILGDSDPNQISSSLFARPGTAGHPLGTDQLGRDVLDRLIYGVRISLLVGVVSSVVAVVVGGLIGAVAGFGSRRLDMVLMRVTEFFQTIPVFILAAVVVAVGGTSTALLILVIGLLAWPDVARIMRGRVLQVKHLEYVDAVRCLGVSSRIILTREVVPNAMGPALALAPLIVGQSILLSAGLGFLGLTSPDTVSWGGMLNEGQNYLFQAWWLSVLPGIGILVTVIGFGLLGDALSDLLNPRRRSRP